MGDEEFKVINISNQYILANSWTLLLMVTKVLQPDNVVDVFCCNGNIMFLERPASAVENCCSAREGCVGSSNTRVWRGVAWGTGFTPHYTQCACYRSDFLPRNSCRTPDTTKDCVHMANNFYYMHAAA